MKHVASRENPLFKSLLRTAGHAGRRGEPALLEGVHLCQAWLQHAGPPALAVFDAERADRPELAALLGGLPPERVALLEPRLLRSLESVDAGQGVLFAVDPPRPALPARLDRACVWLDRIQDPGNLGTLLRTAAAAGISQAYLSPGCAGAWSPKVLRGAQGAHFAMRLYEDCDLAALHARLRVPLIATALDDARSLYDEPLPRECAWLLGNEGQGVAAELLGLADRRVFIPQAAGVESLNVAAAAAICLFEHRRQSSVGEPSEV